MNADHTLTLRVWDYATSVAAYWQFWLAFAFFAERSIERFFPRVAQAANRILPAD
jgi:hypothetical protein